MTKYLMLKEAADYLSVSQNTLSRRIADGSLKAHRIGGKTAADSAHERRRIRIIEEYLTAFVEGEAKGRVS